MNDGDRRHIDWRLGWIDRRRAELQAELNLLYQNEREVLAEIKARTHPPHRRGGLTEDEDEWIIDTYKRRDGGAKSSQTCY